MSQFFVKFNNFITDPDKKPYRQIAWEAIKCGFAERELPRHYFTRLLYKKGADNYLDYMGVRKNNRLAALGVIHNHSMAPLLDNKLCFSMFMEGKPGVKIAKVLGFNFKNAFFYGTNYVPEMLDDEDKVLAFLQGLPEHSQGAFGEIPGVPKVPGERIFIKPIDGRQGQNCFLVNPSGSSLSDASAKAIVPVLLQGSFLYQEVLEQHRDIKAIYPHSLNTIRIDTFMDSQGKVSLMTGLMRFGVEGRVVDNITAGGIFVPIDMETGRLKPKAFRLLEHGGNIYTEHPDTGFVFKGFEIPYFEQVREMLVAAVRLIPDILLGWDVAVTPEGPVIIEGSQYYSPRMSEMAYGGYNNHPVYKEILKGL